jgi:hypothetical protein
VRDRAAILPNPFCFFKGKIMKFVKAIPHRWGWYWVVDVSYPSPFIAYVAYGGFTAPSKMYEIHGKTIDLDKVGHHYRFGEEIIPPGTQSMEIET